MMKYRPDIDGLRAMAIIAVILYHAFPGVIKGGFVGVDIFFVISGYLITAIIFKDLDSNHFSIYNFYARRIKRILPALIVVITTCFILGWLVLTSDEYIHLARHARSSALFLTNFVLAREENSYFDAASHAKPLMHLWSLAIEEQFYIVWPLLLYFTRSKKMNFISVSIAIILISFFFGLKVLKINSVHAFYFAWLRSWELVSGALCAYLAYHKIEIIERLKNQINHCCNLIIYSNSKDYKEATSRNFASILGFLINSYSILLFNDTITFPGLYAALPVIGTMLMLSAGETAWINNKILARKLCVWVGLISYPLYLWHWPLLSFAFIIEGQMLDRKLKLIILFISFLLSWITYRFIEKPIRSAKDRKYIVAILLGMLLVIGVFAHRVIKNDGYEWRAASLGQVIEIPPREYKKLEKSLVKCQEFLGIPDISFTTDEDKRFCFTNTLKPKILIIGDSHALNFAVPANLDKSFDLLALIQYGNLPFENYSVDTDSGDLIKKTGDFSINQYISKNIDYYDSLEWVIIEVSAGKFGKASYIEPYVELINFLISKNMKVIFVLDFPYLDFDPKSCQERPIKISNSKPLACLISRSKVDANQKAYRERVAELKKRVPSLMVYDPIEVFCDESNCYGKQNKMLLYYDNSHINMDGGRLLINDFNQKFKMQIK